MSLASLDPSAYMRFFRGDVAGLDPNEFINADFNVIKNMLRYSASFDTLAFLSMVDSPKYKELKTLHTLVIDLISYRYRTRISRYPLYYLVTTPGALSNGTSYLSFASMIALSGKLITFKKILNVFVDIHHKMMSYNDLYTLSVFVAHSWSSNIVFSFIKALMKINHIQGLSILGPLLQEYNPECFEMFDSMLGRKIWFVPRLVSPIEKLVEAFRDDNEDEFRNLCLSYYENMDFELYYGDLCNFIVLILIPVRDSKYARIIANHLADFTLDAVMAKTKLR